ncbi:hypothetical protein FVE85_7805 [Porphyridium purpureum]|uniref:Uncharacterized protein n=1 Tax=Porphyridium purpureum TaxID=35688 RepID=A0A5J4YKZ5_PORPP|nr:hypothetical protein FVE85_7805 [Porphyridium purpureum]|eukprot:POR9545..scf210_14
MLSVQNKVDLLKGRNEAKLVFRSRAHHPAAICMIRPRRLPVDVNVKRMLSTITVLLGVALQRARTSSLYHDILRTPAVRLLRAFPSVCIDAQTASGRERIIQGVYSQCGDVQRNLCVLRDRILELYCSIMRSKIVTHSVETSLRAFHTAASFVGQARIDLTCRFPDIDQIVAWNACAITCFALLHFHAVATRVITLKTLQIDRRFSGIVESTGDDWIRISCDPLLVKGQTLLARTWNGFYEAVEMHTPRSSNFKVGNYLSRMQLPPKNTIMVSLVGAGEYVGKKGTEGMRTMVFSREGDKNAAKQLLAVLKGKKIFVTPKLMFGRSVRASVDYRMRFWLGFENLSADLAKVVKEASKSSEGINVLKSRSSQLAKYFPPMSLPREGNAMKIVTDHVKGFSILSVAIHERRPRVPELAEMQDIKPVPPSNHGRGMKLALAFGRIICLHERDHLGVSVDILKLATLASLPSHCLSSKTLNLLV